MKVCIIRNADARSNASMLRVLDALLYGDNQVIILSRTRENTGENRKIIKNTIDYGNHIVENYEIQLPAERAKGVNNIYALFIYIFMTINWLLKNRKKFDCIHSFDLDTGISGALVSKILKKKFVYHIADFYADSRPGIPTRFNNIIKQIEYSVINKSDLTIVCTEQRKEQIEGSNPKKLIVIHNTPVLNYNKKLENQHSGESLIFNEQRKLMISYVGGLSETRFINEILEVVSENSHVRIDIAGYGPLEKKVKSYSEKFDNINFCGRVDYSQSLKINANSDLMIAMYDPKVRNHQYSAPNKVYEAMIFGKTIIVSNNTGVDDLVRNERIGLTSEYTKEDFNNIISSIIEQPQILEEYSNNARKTYNKYSWDVMRKRLLKSYSNL